MVMRIPRAVLLIVVSLSLLLVASVTGRGWAQSGGVEVVYVANGYVAADALAGGPLAAATNSPILTVAGPQQGDVLPDATAAALRALSPDRIVILGGPAAVSESVEQELRPYAQSGTVERVAGNDRFGTAAAVADALQSAGQDPAGGVVSIGVHDFVTDDGTVRRSDRVRSSGSGYVSAPVHLPDGARITAVRAWLHDNSGESLRPWLYEQPHDRSEPRVSLFEGETGTSERPGDTVLDLDQSDPANAAIVDAAANAYFVRVDTQVVTLWSDDTWVYGLRITYEMT